MNWIPVILKLPPHGVNVLATYKNSHGKRRFIIGHYLERWKEESDCDDCNYEYSEELDNYYLREGWYENQENWGDYSSIVVHEGSVSHWIPLPDGPEETSNETTKN